MKLTIKNICSVQEMNVEFNGITIVAGKNGTGKSTLSRSLWTIYRSLYKTKEYIEMLIKKKIIDYLKKININNANFKHNSILELAIELYSFRRDVIVNQEGLLENVKNAILEFISSNQIGCLKYNDNIFNEIILDIVNLIKKKDDEIITNRFMNYLNSEFNLFPYDARKKDKQCVLEIGFNNGNINCINVIGENEVKFRIDEDIQFPIFYFDGLNVDYNLDLNEYNDSRVEDYRHKDAFDSSLYFGDVSMSIDRDDEYSEIIDNIFSKFGYFGKVYRENDILNYKETNYLYPVSPHLIAQGLKNIIVLYQFFRTKRRDKRTLLILDEPEMNLHPEWQVVLAEVICELEQYLDLTILLCSHSPWFISALKTYIGSEKYNMNKIAKYYLTSKDDDNNSVILDVTQNPDKIFKNLYTPIIELKEKFDLL